MEDFEYHKYIEASHKKYLKLGFVQCHALDDIVVFNRKGFDHLIGKNGRLRSRNEVMERLDLLCYVKEVINSRRSDVTKRFTSSTAQDLFFWGLTVEVKNGIKIRVVIRQINTGPKHFYSIMRKIT